jgi:hypothetical protein
MKETYLSETEPPPSPKDDPAKPTDWKDRFDAWWKSSRIVVGVVVLIAVVSALSPLKDGFKAVRETIWPEPREDPEFIISGRISLQNVPALPPGVITAKIFWIDPAASDRASLIQSPELSQVESAKGNMTYKLAFFDDPPESAIHTTESPSHAIAAQMAIGRIGVFVDAGSDGFFNQDKDTLIAANTKKIVLWRRLVILRHTLTAEDKYYVGALKDTHFGFCIASDRWDADGEYAGVDCDEIDQSNVDFTVNEKDVADLNRKLLDELTRSHKKLPELGTITPKATP